MAGPPPPAPGETGRWHYRRSLASRVIWLTTIAVGLAVALVATGAYVTARMQLRSELDSSLLERAQVTARYNLLGNPADNIPPWAVGASDVRIFFLQDNNLLQVIDGGTPLPVAGKREFAVARGDADRSVRTLEADDERYRVVAVPTRTEGRALIIAQSLEQQEQVLSRLGAVSLLFGLLGVLGAGATGWAVARNGLRPVRRLTERVEHIAQTEDLTPMPVEGDDEIARLAGAFNQMLVALDASRTRQRRLVTDAGHELRTPLTSLRTNIDLLIQSDSTDDSGPTLPPEARAELLDDVRAQTDELTTLIGDLTELARDEPLAPVVGEVDLSEVVDDAVARVRRRATTAHFDVDARHWFVVGEAPALERAVTNLLDNAAKWGPPGGTITVRLAGGVLTVDDQGPGIAEADRQRVFDRFWRAEESRTMPGSGLGLAIVRQVVERHAGTVEVATAPGGGARLVVRIPGRPGDQEETAR